MNWKPSNCIKLRVEGKCEIQHGDRPPARMLIKRWKILCGPMTNSARPQFTSPWPRNFCAHLNVCDIPSLRSINGAMIFLFPSIIQYGPQRCVCVCALEMLRVAEEEEKSLSSRRGKMKQGFSLFKSHTRPLIFMFFFLFFCSGLSHKSGRNGPSSFGVSDRSFFFLLS